MVDKGTGIWTLEEAKKRHRFDESLARVIYEMYLPKSIADLGCGTGAYCRIFSELGCDIVHGYEGTKDISQIGLYKDIIVLDLTKKRYSDLKYDLVICLEVGEHIPKKHEDTVIWNICQFVDRHLVLSWAVPNQGGLGHFNEHPNEYVIEKLAKMGLFLDLDKSNLLREKSTLKWFKNTVMAYERRSV